MIHFHFGKLQEWFQRKDSEATFRGTHGLMIEIADWTIERKGATLATSNTCNGKIDGVLPQFLGKRVASVRFGDRCSRLTFEEALVLSLFPNSGSYGAWHSLENWTIFRGERAVLTLTTKAKLSVPQG